MKIDLQNQIIQKNIVQTNEIKNRLLKTELSNFYIEKEYEIKSNYFNEQNKDITNQPDQWRESIFNKSDIKIMWDNKTNLFAFNFKFLNKNVDLIQFTFNNEKTKIIKPNFDYENSVYTQTIYGIELFDELNDIDKIKTMQITLKNNKGSRVISLVFEKMNKYKQDYYIPKNKSLILKFQNSIKINGENTEKTFSTIKFSPKELKQGFWNQDFLQIVQQNNEVFDRNLLEIISFGNLPISTSSKSTFSAKIASVDNLTSIVKVDQNTYYNLEKKETMIGFGPNSNSGYIVPFEFSGIFYPILNININGLEFLISWEYEFKKPYFKNDEGLNIINLNYSYIYDESNKWIPISSELMNEAKKYNFTFEELKEWLIKKEDTI